MVSGFMVGFASTTPRSSAAQCIGPRAGRPRYHGPSWTSLGIGTVIVSGVRTLHFQRVHGRVFPTDAQQAQFGSPTSLRTCCAQINGDTQASPACSTPSWYSTADRRDDEAPRWSSSHRSRVRALGVMSPIAVAAGGNRNRRRKTIRHGKINRNHDPDKSASASQPVDPATLGGTSAYSTGFARRDRQVLRHPVGSVVRMLSLAVAGCSSNPLDIGDIGIGLPFGQSVDLAWTTWRNERTGIAIGVWVATLRGGGISVGGRGKRVV